MFIKLFLPLKMNEDGVVCRLCVSVWQGVKDLTVSCFRITASLSMEFIISGMNHQLDLHPVLEFLNNLWGARKRVGIGLSYRLPPPPPGYIVWRNKFLGINSWAP
jgi:hypothetical protein